MAALGAVQLSLFPASSSSSKFLSTQKQLTSVRLNLASSSPSLSLKFPFSPLRLNNNNPTTKPCFVLLCSAVQEAATTEEETAEQSQGAPYWGKQVILLKLPLSLTVEDLKTMLSECGTVVEAELKTKTNGKSRGFGFFTMSTREEAQAVIDKFDSYEMLGKIMRVQFANSFKKPDLPPRPSRGLESRVHVANLDLKVRAADLREFFSASFNPTSARVVIHKNKETKYGFVGFATKEEAEAAIAVLDRKELMGRQLHLAWSNKNIDESASKKEEQDLSEGQLNES